MGFQFKWSLKNQCHLSFEWAIPFLVSAKHRETKQYFTLYNTLNDTKQYLTKELSLLNSIYENYTEYVYTQPHIVVT